MFQHKTGKNRYPSSLDYFVRVSYYLKTTNRFKCYSLTTCLFVSANAKYRLSTPEEMIC